MINLKAAMSGLSIERLKILHNCLLEASLGFELAQSKEIGKRRARAIFEPMRSICKGQEKKVYAALCTAKPDAMDRMIKRLVDELS